jgi:hypothetical protein
MAGLLGLGLALALGLALPAIPGLFTQDAEVLQLLAALLPLVVASQPINSLAFVWDGACEPGLLYCQWVLCCALQQTSWWHAPPAHSLNLARLPVPALNTGVLFGAGGFR